MTLLFSDKFIHALGWTLLHSLWQVGLAALLLYLILSYSKKATAHFRYGLAIITLALSAGLTIGTFVYEYLPTSAASGQTLEIYHPPVAYYHAFPVAQAYVKGVSPSHPTEPFLSLAAIRQIIDQHMNILVAAWICGVILLSLRLLGGCIYTRKLKQHPDNVFYKSGQHKVRLLAGKIGLDRKIQVMMSCMAKVPMVIGHLKPVILIPVSLVTTLPTDQLEAVLAHELAHIYRKDYWVNILQSLVEIVFFYHPAIWWISAVVRNERENCCDDLAVSLCGNTLTYAKALTRIEESRQQLTGLAMAATGKKGSLLQRIERLLQPESKDTHFSARYIAALAMLFIVITAGTGMAYKTYESPFHASLARIFDVPQINTDNQSGAKVAAKTSLNFRESRPNEQFQPQKEQYPEKGESYPETGKAIKSSENQIYRLVQRKNEEIATDTLHPLLPEEAQDLMLDMNLDSLWEPGLDSVNWDIDIAMEPNAAFAFHLDSLAGYQFFNFPDTTHAFSFYWNGPDSSGMVFNLSQGLVPFVGDTLPPAGIYLSDSMMDTYLRPLDSLRALRFQLKDSLMQQHIQQKIARAQAQVQRLQEQWRDSLYFNKLQAQLERNEEVLRAQSKALAKQAEVLRRQAEEFERKAAKLEAKAKEKEKEKEKNKNKNTNLDESTRLLEEALLKDGLISKGHPYTFEINQDQLKINGKKQPKAVYQKYADLLAEKMNLNLKEGGNFSLSKNPYE